MNIDTLLYNEAKCLFNDAELSVDMFLHIASLEDLRQQDWAVFWNKVHEKQHEDKKFDVTINGKDYRLDKNELRFVNDTFGYCEKDSNKFIFNK